MKSQSLFKEPYLVHKQRPYSSKTSHPVKPLSALSRRPITSKPKMSSALHTQISEQSSPNLNLLKLIIDNDPTQPSSEDIEKRLKSFQRNSESYFNQNNAKQNVKNLYFKYNILYGNNSSNIIKTYLPKMRPISSSVRGYSKYKLKRNVTFLTAETSPGNSFNEEQCIFTNNQIEKLFEAKCQDLCIEPNERSRLNFFNACQLNASNRNLDLRDFNISVQFMKALLEILTDQNKLDEIAQVKLGKNPLGDNSLKYIMKIISSSKSITHLDLSSANITYKKGYLIFSSLINHKSLISLDLSSKENAYRNRLLSYSMEQAKQMLLHNNFLEYLDLSGNSIKNEGFKLIMEGINGSDGHLVSLNLSHNDITNEGMKYFSILNKTIPLENINLSDNAIKSEGLIIICKKSQFLKKLSKLYLDNCHIDFQGFLCLIQTYGHGSHRIDTLILDNNKLGNKRFEILKELFKNFNVNNLSLKNCDLSDICVSYLGDFLKINEVLKSVNLSSNKISDRAFYVYRTLPECTRSLEKIDLSNNLIHDTSAIPFIRNLSENFTLKEINLSNNQVQNETAAEFINILESNKHLISVNLSLNFIKSELIDSINGFLKANKKRSQDKYIPGLKASIKNNKIEEGEYDLCKELIEQNKKHQIFLETSVKEDEIKYDTLKKKYDEKVKSITAYSSDIETQLQQYNDSIQNNIQVKENEDIQFKRIANEIEENMKLINKEIKTLEEQHERLNKDVAFNKLDYDKELKKYQKDLELMKEKLSLAETNKKYKTYELEQKNKLLKELIDGVTVSPKNFQRNVLKGINNLSKMNRGQTLKSGGTMSNKLKETVLTESSQKPDKEKKGNKKRGASAKPKAKQSKAGKTNNKNKKNVNINTNTTPNKTIEINKTFQRTFTGFPMENTNTNTTNTNNNTVINDNTSNRIIMNTTQSKPVTTTNNNNNNEYTTTSTSKYKETELTSQKNSVLNTITN